MRTGSGGVTIVHGGLTLQMKVMGRPLVTVVSAVVVSAKMPVSTKIFATGAHNVVYSIETEELLDWKSVVEENFLECSPAVAACLSCSAALLLDDVSVCPAVVLVGPPSTAKTTVLDFFSVEGLTHKLDAFSAKAMISHFAGSNENELAKKIDMLPQIRHKVVFVADLSPMFSKRVDDLMENIGILTRVLDGQGYISHSGVHGQRGEHGDYRFGFIAATTPVGGQVWRVMSSLGPRLMLFDMPIHKESLIEQRQDMVGVKTYADKVADCREVVSAVLTKIWNDNGAQVGGLHWDRASDPEDVLNNIIRLAELGVVLRSVTAKEKVVTGNEYEYSPSVLEGPARYRQSLYNLARGHALVNGRRNLTIADLELPKRIVLSTGPVERLRLLRYLINDGNINSANQAAEIIGHAWSTSNSVMKQMLQLGLVRHGTEYYYLDPKYDWIKELRV
jgi:hypothetical protein